MFGLAYSYGVFFGPMAAAFRTGSGAGSAVFSVTSLLFFCLGAVTGPLADRVGPRKVLIAGSIALAIGLVGASWAAQIWQAYLAYGLGVGLGVGCFYVPVLAVVGNRFERRRAWAIGVTVSGIGLGTVVVPPVSAVLVHTLGWRGTYQLYAAIIVVILPAIALMLTSSASSTAAAPAPARSPRRTGFRTLYASALLLNLTLYVPFVHLPRAAEQQAVSPTAAAGLVSVVGACSIIGRLALSSLADRVGSLPLYRACYGLAALSFGLWALAVGYVPLLVFAIVLGMAYGGYIALTPIVLGEQFGAAELSRTLGVLYTAVGIGAAVGPALVGYAEQSAGSFTWPALGLAAAALAGLSLIVRWRIQ